METPDGEQGSVNDPGQPSRREFVRKVGTIIFTLAFIGKLGGAPTEPLSAPALDPVCSPPTINGPGTPDANCSATVADAGCGLVPHGPGKDASKHDEDQHCTSAGTSADAACGDCDDWHDADEHCASGNGAGGLDQDELCGHPHWAGGHNDQGCGKADPTTGAPQSDAGCGIHDRGYSMWGSWTDTDDNCNVGNDVDNNCANWAEGASDDTCGSHPTPFASDPDERCGVNGDMDEACGQSGTAPGYKQILVDVDANCGHGNDEDQTCCTSPPEIAWNYDENCGKGVDVVDRDQSCYQTVGNISDAACGIADDLVPSDVDEHCGPWGKGEMDIDQNCRFGRAMPDGSPDVDQSA